MKTPDEIKKGLRCLAWDDVEDVECSDCIYHHPETEDCISRAAAAVLAYIQRQEQQLAERDARIAELERERDAAIADMTELMRGSEYCMFCKYLSEDGECTRPILEGRAMCWEWRGVQEVE